eukprot:229054-Rhodomonas_salina.1
MSCADVGYAVVIVLRGGYAADTRCPVLTGAMRLPERCRTASGARSLRKSAQVHAPSCLRRPYAEPGTHIPYSLARSHGTRALAPRELGRLPGSSWLADKFVYSVVQACNECPVACETQQGGDNWRGAGVVRGMLPLSIGASSSY